MVIKNNKEQKMDYKNGKIYKIVSDLTDKIYIGSTCQPLCKRISKHRNNFKSFKEGKYGLNTSFEIIKLGNYFIVLIENVECDNKEQLFARERYYIELHKDNCVNKYIPTRSIKEWTDDNKADRKKYQEKYYFGLKI